MKKKYLKKVDKKILWLTVALILIGLAAVSSASSVLSFQRFGHNNYYFFRQGVFALVAFAAMWFFSKVNYKLWNKWSGRILLSSIFILILTLIPGIGTKVGGSRSWIEAGLLFIQPSEFFKLAVIFYLSSWFDRKENAENNFWYGVLPPLIATGVLAGLIVLQPDLGTALMYGVIVFSMLFAAGVRLKYLFALLAATAAAAWALITIAPYRAARITSFFDPSTDPLGIGYHINQALLAIGSGGFFGQGFGQSIQKHNYLPEPIADSIFAVMAEELGFLRISIIIIMFILFAWWGTKLAKKAPDKFSQLTVVGITSWVVMQAVINIGAISRVFPLTGIGLPFISYGGSSLLALSIAVGVMLNISRYRR